MGGGGFTNLGLSPKNYQFFDGFPKTNLYLIELITNVISTTKTDLSAWL